MAVKGLISVDRLQQQLAEGAVRVVDCRFDLTDPQRGRKLWLAGHIPGAAYADLDKNLSSPVTAESGRHPLPDPESFASWLAGIGWHSDLTLVAYDDGNGMLASRLWWLMRYFGHSAVLLDGGLAAWQQAGLPLESEEKSFLPEEVPELVADPSLWVSTEQVRNNLQAQEFVVVDARTTDRFSGEVEPLDSRAGHIPGALNYPFPANLGPDGRFLSPAVLREKWMQCLGERPPETVVHSCGSGVTACHNHFAMELAGLSGSRIYPGSWSEWIRDPNRPIETPAK